MGKVTTLPSALKEKAVAVTEGHGYSRGARAGMTGLFDEYNSQEENPIVPPELPVKDGERRTHNRDVEAFPMQLSVEQIKDILHFDYSEQEEVLK